MPWTFRHTHLAGHFAGEAPARFLTPRFSVTFPLRNVLVRPGGLSGWTQSPLPVPPPAPHIETSSLGPLLLSLSPCSDLTPLVSRLGVSTAG